MQKTKLTLLLVTPLLCLAGLVGCNKKADKDTISIAVVSDKAEYDTILNFINKYKAIPGNEGKKFKPIKMTNYNDYINNSFMYDELADIVQVYDFSCEYFTNADLDGIGTSLLQPISEYMQRDGIKESDFYESIIEMTKCKTGSNEMYWVPRDYNKVVCAYNKDIFDIAEVEYPSANWTWADFVHICNELETKASIIKQQYSGSATFFPVDMNLDFTAVYYPILKSYGVDLIDKETKTCFGNIPEKLNTAKEAWAKLLDMADDKLAAPPGGSQIPFTNKQAAMMFMVRPNLPTYVSSLGEKAIDFVSLPTYDDLLPGQKSLIGMGCSGYGMTTACPNSKKEAVWDFLKFIISEDGQNAFSESGAGIPCLKKLATDPNAVFKQYMVSEDNHPNHDAFIDYPERDVPMNFMKGFEVDKQLMIEKFIKDRTLKNFYEAKGAARDKYYTDYKTEMEKIWK